MPFIPHTEKDISEMLDAIGAPDIESLFDEVPADLRCGPLDAIPETLSEMAVNRLLNSLAAKDSQLLNFAGAGAYEHHIPAAVWQLTTRGEFYTAYTPYQAEASQGTLQIIYEYQSMISGLTGMDVSNASMYDGASALAEAVLMAVRGNRKSKSKKILMPSTVHPIYRSVTHAIVANQGIELVELPHDPATGIIDPASLAQYSGEDFAALVIPQPNFFGALEEVDVLTDWAEENKAFSIAVINPTTLGALKPPGEWGNDGVDIVCGEGQPLGAPLSSGGPYFGILTCKQKHVRQMPGRIVGRTTDADDKTGFVLTLQAREQHIRRSKATSNICTNQGLMVTASTIYMSLLGNQGLKSVAAQCYANTHQLVELADKINVSPAFSSEFFHEVVFDLKQPAAAVLEKMADQGILGGYDLGKHYAGMGNCLLVCTTETKTEEDLNQFIMVLDAALKTGD